MDKERNGPFLVGAGSAELNLERTAEQVELLDRLAIVGGRFSGVDAGTQIEQNALPFSRGTRDISIDGVLRELPAQRILVADQRAVDFQDPGALLRVVAQLSLFLLLHRRVDLQ